MKIKFKKPIALLLAAVIVSGLILSIAAVRHNGGFGDEDTDRIGGKGLSAGNSFAMSGLIFTELDDGTYEVGYNYKGNKPEGTVTIPSTVNGRYVTRIAEGGFYGCDKLKYIEMPSSVVGAGANAFTGTALLNAQEDETVKYVGNIAVYCDPKATAVKVEEGTVGLADKLFCNVEELKSVSLPQSLVNMGSMTFDGCAQLTSVNIPNGIETIGSGMFSGCAALSSVKIPDSVTSIGAYAFADSGLTSADLLNVKRIGKGAFENSKLGEGSVYLVDDYVDIGGRAFADTEFYEKLGDEKYLGSVFLGGSKNVSSVDIKDGTLAIADMAFSGCRALTDVTIPESVRTIGSDAFFNCTSLASLTIPEGVESIGEDAFRLCSGLTSVSLPMSLSSAGQGAFYGCDNVRTLTYPGSVTDMSQIEGGDAYALPYADSVKLENNTGKSIDAVRGLKVTDTSYDSATLTWKKPSLATGYTVEVYKNGQWTLAGRTEATTFTVTGLDQCTEYEFRVSAGAHSVLGLPAKTKGKTLLAPVRNVRTTPSLNEIMLTWDMNDKADGYMISVLKDGSWESVTHTVSNATTSCKVTGLLEKTKYLFRVTAFKRNGSSGSEQSLSTVVSASTSDPDRLAAVTELTASSTAGTITLSWNGSKDADSYQIDMRKNGEWVFVAKVTSTAYTVTGLDPDTKYEFKVFAFKGEEYSESVSITAATRAEGEIGTDGSGKPEAVTGLSASATSDSVTLSWNASEGADSYQVDMFSSGKWIYLDTITDTSYTVTDLIADKEYQFKVFAFNGTLFSSSASVTAFTGTRPDTDTEPGTDTDTTPDPDAEPALPETGDGTGQGSGSSLGTNVGNVGVLTPVKDLEADVSTDSVTLKWGVYGSADKFQIDMLKNGKWVYAGTTTDKTYTIAGLAPDTDYQFKVFLFLGNRYSRSSRITAHTASSADQLKPAPVTGLTASATNNSVTLNWKESSHADSYQVDIFKNGKWVYIAKVTDTTCTVSGLSENTNYQFKVFAFNGEQYSSSTSVTAYTKSGASSGTAASGSPSTGKPTAVTGLKATPGSGSITLSWDKNSTADSYQIDIYKNGKWTFLAKIEGNAYTVNGLAADLDYKFKVFAFNDSQYSSSVTVTARTASVLAPEQSVLAPSDTSVGLSGMYTKLKGIDVSGWQGIIDFNAVKESGVDFVIVKAGGGYSTVETWETNYANAKKAGLMVGAYWFSFATTIEEGRYEGRAFVDALHGKQLDFPVYFDIENAEQFDLGQKFCSELTDTFCGVLEKAGYYTGVYCSTNWFTSHMTDRIKLSRPVWMADYRGGCYYQGAYEIWQHGIGEVSGVQYDCDLNWGYVDYSGYIKENHLNGY